MAINIPLALLFAFSVFYLRGKSANLLSIGAVDFGIIVDSSVIMVENIYRHLTSGLHAELAWKERIARASGEILRSLFFSTAIMVCAFLPLFTMDGPEGQMFGPMAETYAFALGGALLLSLHALAGAVQLAAAHGAAAARKLVRPLAAGELSAATPLVSCAIAAGRWPRSRPSWPSRWRRCRCWAASSCPSWRRETFGSGPPFP